MSEKEPSVAEVWAVDSNDCPYGNNPIEDDEEETPAPALIAILDAYDPDNDGPSARITRTDYRIAEALTNIESIVRRQHYEIEQLKAALAEKPQEMPY